MNVGICEDDDRLRQLLREVLEDAGYTVRSEHNATDALRTFAASPPDVLLLDVMLPDADGRDVCQALRATGVQTPVLFLTARDAVTDRVSGFHAGGDDYLVKPFAVAELLARVQALLKRSPASEPTPIGHGLTLDAAGHALCFHERRVILTPTEFRILARLAAAPSKTYVRRDALVAAAWPDGAIVHDNTLDVYVARLRRRLRELDADRWIHTLRGVGYALSSKPS